MMWRHCFATDEWGWELSGGIVADRKMALRHTAISLLLALGVPPHVVREIVGTATSRSP